MVPPRPLYGEVPDVDAVHGHGTAQGDVELAGAIDVGRGDGDVVTAPGQLARQSHRSDGRPPVTRREAGYDVEDSHSTRNGPSTSVSMPVRLKQSSACSGVLTIGSLSLNEVFSTTGTPVSLSNALMSSW